MVQALVRLLALAGAALPGMMVLGHPGADIHAEAASRAEHLSKPERRSMASCRRSLEESGHFAQELSRRMERIDALRSERVLGGSISGPVNSRKERAGCVLDPEVTEGPYWVEGHLIRPDLREGSPGVELHVDVNVFDVTTCQPIPNVYVELWSCNSTGVYTGIVNDANGNGKNAPEEINNSALRGLQATDAAGTARFITLVPGHYTGRTNHIHTIVHHGATRLDNNTIQGGTISHVGQFYFDQALLSSVEALDPYSTNTQPVTLNDDDILLPMGRANGDNPFLEITMLGGGGPRDGLHGVIDVGVDPSAVQKPQPVNKWTDHGGEPVPGSPWKDFPPDDGEFPPMPGFPPNQPGGRKARKRSQ